MLVFGLSSDPNTGDRWNFRLIILNFSFWQVFGLRTDHLGRFSWLWNREGCKVSIYCKFGVLEVLVVSLWILGHAQDLFFEDTLSFLDLL